MRLYLVGEFLQNDKFWILPSDRKLPYAQHITLPSILYAYFAIRPPPVEDILERAVDLVRLLHVMLVAVGCGAGDDFSRREAEKLVVLETVDGLLEDLVASVCLGGGEVDGVNGQDMVRDVLAEACRVFQLL